MGTITTDGSSPKHNNRVVEPKGYEYAGVAVHPVSKKLEFDGYKDTSCPTLLATDWKCPKTILEERSGTMLRWIEGIGDFKCPNCNYDSEYASSFCPACGIDLSEPKESGIEPLVYDGFNQQVRQDNSTIGTITRNVVADLKRNGQGIIEPKQTDFRVRKLTERECFRLQGVKDTDFAKIRQNQSKSSCYHLAGDSITTSVLMALFGQMLGIDWKSKVDELVKDLQEIKNNEVEG